VVALLLALAATLIPAAAPLAGAAAIATGLWLKFTLVVRAAFNQGFALPRLPVRGTR
jgi:phenylacetyl-CoA:acceptor oxidoreductase subunit 2